jgi:hypothetical protein
MPHYKGGVSGAQGSGVVGRGGGGGGVGTWGEREYDEPMQVSDWLIFSKETSRDYGSGRINIDQCREISGGKTRLIRLLNRLVNQCMLCNKVIMRQYRRLWQFRGPRTKQPCRSGCPACLQVIKSDLIFLSVE